MVSTRGPQSFSGSNPTATFLMSPPWFMHLCTCHQYRPELHLRRTPCRTPRSSRFTVSPHTPVPLPAVSTVSRKRWVVEEAFVVIKGRELADRPFVTFALFLLEVRQAHSGDRSGSLL